MALPLSYNVRNIIVRWKLTLLAVGGIAFGIAGVSGGRGQQSGQCEQAHRSNRQHGR